MTFFWDKDYLRVYSEEIGATSVGGPDEWNENYVSNIFMSRFVATKFIDNTLAIAGKYRPVDVDELRRMTIAKVVATLPEPLYNQFSVGYPKSYIMSYSMGDLMYYLSTGRLISGFKAGSLIGHGVATIGYFFPLFIIGFSFPMFVFFDSLFRSGSAVVGGVRSGLRSVGRPVLPPRGVCAALLLSPFAIIFIYDFFNFWTAESISGYSVTLIRGFAQRMFFYWAFISAGRFFFGR